MANSKSEVKLTKARYANNVDGEDLSKRIEITKYGQVTWAQPSLNQRCTRCRHFANGGVTKGEKQGFGRCHLVKVFGEKKKQGELFDGATAIACSKFEIKQ